MILSLQSKILFFCGLDGSRAVLSKNSSDTRWSQPQAHETAKTNQSAENREMLKQYPHTNALYTGTNASLFIPKKWICQIDQFRS